MKRRARIAAGAAAVVALLVGVAAVASGAGSATTATCTATYSSSTVTSVCPLPPQPTATVTVTASPSAQPTVTPTPTATPTVTPTATPTVTPTATPTSSSGFPDASTTGARGTLTPYTGPATITKAGTVIENAKISGRVEVRADNVTLRNVQITTGDYYGLITYAANTTVTDSTIVGGDTASIACYGTGLRATRVDVSGGEDGVRLANNSSLVDSYVHDLEGDADSHYDAVTADGYTGWTITGNTILNSHGQTSAIWVGDPRYGPSSGVLSGNLLAGGGYALYGGPGTSAGIKVTGNTFSRRYFAKVGYYGVSAYWQTANNTWSGNVDDSGKSVSP